MEREVTTVLRSISPEWTHVQIFLRMCEPGQNKCGVLPKKIFSPARLVARFRFLATRAAWDQTATHVYPIDPNAELCFARESFKEREKVKLNLLHLCWAKFGARLGPHLGAGHLGPHLSAPRPPRQRFKGFLTAADNVSWHVSLSRPY